MSGVRISPKHGANPTIPICFFCGKEKNEVALLGKINKEDDEAPRNMVLDYEPCDDCKKNMSLGVTLIGTTANVSDNRRPIGKNEDGENVYPTGEWIVITREAAYRYFKEIVTEEEIDNIEKILVDQEFIDYLNDQMKQLEDEV